MRKHPLEAGTVAAGLGVAAGAAAIVLTKGEALFGESARLAETEATNPIRTSAWNLYDAKLSPEKKNQLVNESTIVWRAMEHGLIVEPVDTTTPEALAASRASGVIKLRGSYADVKDFLNNPSKAKAGLHLRSYNESAGGDALRESELPNSKANSSTVGGGLTELGNEPPRPYYLSETSGQAQREYLGHRPMLESPPRETVKFYIGDMPTSLADSKSFAGPKSAEAIRKILTRLDIEPNKMLMVGDNPKAGIPESPI